MRRATEMVARMPCLTTLPRLLQRNARELGARPAMREKDRGIWQTWNWRQYHDQVRDLGLGLASLGLRRGDRLSVIGDNRPRLYWAQVAAQSLGGISVPVYQDSIAKELAYVWNHAEVSVIVAEDQEQVDKVLALRDELPSLRLVVYDDPRGMTGYRHDWLKSVEDVQEAGRKFRVEHPGLFESDVEEGGAADARDLRVLRLGGGGGGDPADRGQAGARRAAAGHRTGGVLRVRPGARPAGPPADEVGADRRRPPRARYLPLLPFDRGEPQAGVRIHRDDRARLAAARPGSESLHRRATGAGGGDQDRGPRGGPGEGVHGVQGLLPERGGDPGGDRSRRLVPDRRRRVHRSPGPSGHHRPSQGCRRPHGRHPVRPAVHREQAQVQPLRPGGRRVRQRQAIRGRHDPHRPGYGGELGGAASHP